MSAKKNCRWTEEENDFLREYYPGHGVDATLQELNKRFDRQLVRQSLCNRVSLLGLKVTSAVRKKQLEATWKANGKTPVEVGYINTDTGMIKTEKGWMRLGAMLGVPKGYYAVHLDGDLSNNTPENIQIIPMKMSMEMTRNKFWSEEPIITKTGIMCLTLEDAIKEV